MTVSASATNGTPSRVVDNGAVTVAKDSYPCLACDQCFQAEADCEQHRMRVHKDHCVVGECLFCGTMFPNQFAFRDHFKEKHPDQFAQLLAHAALRTPSSNELTMVSHAFIRNDDDKMRLIMHAITVEKMENRELTPAEEVEVVEVKPSIEDAEPEEFPFASFSPLRNTPEPEEAGKSISRKRVLEESEMPSAIALKKVKQSSPPPLDFCSLPVDTSQSPLLQMQQPREEPIVHAAVAMPVASAATPMTDATVEAAASAAAAPSSLLRLRRLARKSVAAPATLPEALSTPSLVAQGVPTAATVAALSPVVAVPAMAAAAPDVAAPAVAPSSLLALRRFIRKSGAAPATLPGESSPSSAVQAIPAVATSAVSSPVVAAPTITSAAPDVAAPAGAPSSLLRLRRLARNCKP